jgi:hypothetical protein
MRNFVLTALLSMLCVNGARAACQDWSQHVGRPAFRLIFEGTVNNRPVRMMLHLEQQTGQFDGAFGFNDEPQMLVLSGQMQPNNEGASLEARNSEGRFVGQFVLQFRPLTVSDKDNHSESYGCDSLSGTWLTAPEIQPEPVSLHDNGVIIPDEDKARETNEATAFKFRDAMLKNERGAFIRLLSFPLITETQMQAPATWESAHDVIRNYDKIVTFSKKTIEKSVPHVLETAAGRSLFMNNSIEIEAGKVTRICEATCSVSP